MISDSHIFSREELLLGTEAMQRLAACKVIIFGVGGVGSWCAESLVRSGIGHLTIVDSDVVCPSNINRQLMATTATLGLSKVAVLRERLLSINPYAEITAIQARYSEDTAQGFNLDDYDYIIDAIDSLKDKALLILNACKTGAGFFSSMGAALKMDPSRIRVTEFFDVKGDPLARALRKKLKKMGQVPQKQFLCVSSDELLSGKGQAQHPSPSSPSGDLSSIQGTISKIIDKDNLSLHTPIQTSPRRVNGTIAHITGIFGFTLASLVIRDIVSSC